MFNKKKFARIDNEINRLFRDIRISKDEFLKFGNIVSPLKETVDKLKVDFVLLEERIKLGGVKVSVNTDDFEINEEEEKEWLARQYEEKGFRSYVKTRDLILLKKIAIATENRDWQSALEFNGRRMETLKILAEAEKQAKLLKLEE